MLAVAVLLKSNFVDILVLTMLTLKSKLLAKRTINVNVFTASFAGIKLDDFFFFFMCIGTFFKPTFT